MGFGQEAVKGGIRERIRSFLEVQKSVRSAAKEVS